LLKVSTVSLSRWERDHTYPTWEYHQRIIDYLGYDPFPSCGLKDPYGNETQSVASLSLSPLCQILKTRRLELKLTLKEYAQRLNVDPKTLHGWETGSHQPCSCHQKSIAAFLDSETENFCSPS